MTILLEPAEEINYLIVSILDDILGSLMSFNHFKFKKLGAFIVFCKILSCIFGRVIYHFCAIKTSS